MAVKMQRMGKLERIIQKPERVVMYRALDSVRMPFYQERAYQPYTDIPSPVFTITKVVGEKRKKVLLGSASDHVLD